MRGKEGRNKEGKGMSYKKRYERERGGKKEERTDGKEERKDEKKAGRNQEEKKDRFIKEGRKEKW